MLFAGLFKLLVVSFVIQGTCQGAARARWSPRNGESGEKGDPSAGSALTDKHCPTGSEGRGGQSQQLVAGSIADSDKAREWAQARINARPPAGLETTTPTSTAEAGLGAWNGAPGPWARVGAGPGEAGKGHSSLFMPDSIKIRICDFHHKNAFLLGMLFKNKYCHWVSPFD